MGAEHAKRWVVLTERADSVNAERAGAALVEMGHLPVLFCVARDEEQPGVYALHPEREDRCLWVEAEVARAFERDLQRAIEMSK